MIFEWSELAILIKPLSIVSFSMSDSLKRGLELSDSLSQMCALTTQLEHQPYARFLAQRVPKQPMQESAAVRGTKGSLSLSSGDQETLL